MGEQLCRAPHSAGGRTFPGIPFPAFSSILGALWGRAAGALGCSQLWKIIGAVFGEHTRLQEMFGGIFGTGGGWIYCSDKEKQEFLKWWLSQRGLLDFILIQAPKIVGWILALSNASLAGGNGSCVTEGGRRESQGAAALLHLLCWHRCHIPSLINSSHHSYSPCSLSLLAPTATKETPMCCSVPWNPANPVLGLAGASLCFSKCV